MESHQNRQFLQPLIYALVLTAGMYLGFRIAKAYYVDSSGFVSNSQKTHLDFVIQLLNDKYVDSISTAELYEDGIEGILSNLDPHTVYIPPSETERANEELEGSFYGIGIEFFLYRDTVHISSIVENSPAQKAQLAPGDLIISIDDSLVAGKGWTEAAIVNRIKGTRDSKLKLTLLKPDGKLRNVVLERGSVAFNSINASFLLDSSTAYIQIRLFTENTYAEFHEALAALLKHDVRKLLIDVRGNPGGYMDAVTSILDELIPGKNVLLSTKSKHRTETIESQRDGMFEQGKVAVLIDENSASASEILAGAVQDLDRGTVVGRRSYGKGLVQEQFTLPNQGALRLTTARYYLPSGRCIQKDYSHGKEEYRREQAHRNGFTTGGDSTVRSTRQKFYTRNKRIVYDNEGIVPDVFVAPDTLYNTLLDSVYGYSLIEQFAHRYYFFHQPDFNMFGNADAYISGFRLSDSLQREFIAYIHHTLHGFPFNIPQGLIRKVDIILRAEFAKLAFGKNVRNRLLATDDPVITAAMQELGR